MSSTEYQVSMCYVLTYPKENSSKNEINMQKLKRRFIHRSVGMKLK